MATLARGGVGTFAVGVGSALFAVGVQLLLSRTLGVDAFGDYAYTLAWVNFLSMICVIGLDTAALRFIPTYQARTQWSLLRGFRRYALLVTVGLALASAIVGLGLTRWLAAPGLWQVTVAGALLLPVLVVLKMQAGFLQGLRRPVKSQALQGLIRPAILATLIGVLLWQTSGHPSATGAMRVNVAATVLTLAITWSAVRKTLPREVAAARPEDDHADWLKAGLPLLLISASQTLLATTDTLMLGAMSGTKAAGIYAVSSQLATAVTFAITAVNAVLAPMISDLHVRGRHDDLQRVLRFAGRGVLAFALPVCLALWFGGGILLGLFGAAFREGWRALGILAFGQLVIAACGSVGFLMTMTGRERLASLVIGGSAALNIILNAILIPRYGMSGAAVATAVSVSVRSLVLTVLVRRIVGVAASGLAW